MRNIVFFDTETTGVNTQNDKIVEICIIKTDSKFNIIEKFETKINPGIPIPKEATEVHGISDADVAYSPMFSDVAHQIYKMVDGCDVGGYNSNRFDIPLLMAEFERVGVKWSVANVNIVDVYQIELLAKPNSLSSVYKKYTGKELDGAHGAMADTEATIEILRNQIKSMGLPENCGELESLTFEGKPRLDLGGKLVDIDGQVCWNIGKHKGKPLTTDKSYLSWFLGQDVPSDFKEIAKKYL